MVGQAAEKVTWPFMRGGCLRLSLVEDMHSQGYPGDWSSHGQVPL
jgi:hypothetical protein